MVRRCRCYLVRVHLRSFRRGSAQVHHVDDQASEREDCLTRLRADGLALQLPEPRCRSSALRDMFVSVRDLLFCAR